MSCPSCHRFAQCSSGASCLLIYYSVEEALSDFNVLLHRLTFVAVVSTSMAFIFCANQGERCTYSLIHPKWRQSRFWPEGIFAAQECVRFSKTDNTLILLHLLLCCRLWESVGNIFVYVAVVLQLLIIDTKRYCVLYLKTHIGRFLRANLFKNVFRGFQVALRS